MIFLGRCLEKGVLLLTRSLPGVVTMIVNCSGANECGFYYVNDILMKFEVFSKSKLMPSWFGI